MIQTRRIQWFAVFTAALAAGGVLHGQKPEAEPSGAPAAAPKEDRGVTIEVAKKEFEAVKSLRDFGADPKGNLPRLAVPSLHGAGPAVPAGPSAPKRPELESRPSKNWLVDAMEKRSAEKVGRNEKERELEGNREGEDPRAGRNRTRDEEERAKRSEVPNPFTRYLGDWMTPQDLALLKPALEGPLQNDVALGKNTFSGATGENPVVLGELGQKPAFVGGSAPNRQVQPGQVKENPYLEILGSPVGRPGPVPSSGATTRASGPVGPIQVPASVASPPPEAPPSRPGKVPDFVRPNTDDKYFKQLKRF